MIILLLFVAGFVFPEDSRSEEPEIVARVNGEKINRSQLDRMTANPNTLLQAQQELGVEEPDPKQLERLALRKLIHLQLLVQEARRRGITVSQDELDQAVADLRQQFDDLSEFGKWVKEQGLNDPELFETVRNDMLATRAMAALGADVEVSGEQIKEYYEQNSDNLVIGTEVRLRIIAVPEKTEAEDILKKLKKGGNFAQLAYQRSHGKLASRGGDTGWVAFRNLPQLLQESVAKLQKGDVAGPLENDENQYLLVGLQDHRPINAATVEEAYPEIERRLLAEKRQNVVAAWLKEQEEKVDIKIFL